VFAPCFLLMLKMVSLSTRCLACKNNGHRVMHGGVYARAQCYSLVLPLHSLAGRSPSDERWCCRW
jgi:hypothetical protein